jgi:glycine betaine/proline transport system substrate-binding protein
MKMMKKIVIALAAVLLITASFASCTKKEDAKPKVSIVYVEWARAVAITHAAAVILEKKGFDVEVNSVANAAMWASVSTGDSDALLCAWLPVTHEDLYASHKPNIEDLGPNYLGAKLGFVVPGYVTIDSIADMAANADKFGGKITGIDPGAGMSKTIDKAIENDLYGMSAFEHITGSDAIMVAALKDAIDRNEWIAVPGWQPHWMFGEWDLKILDDPEGMWGSEETINTIVRKGLKEENPDAYQFFATFDWASVETELSELLVLNKENPNDAMKNAEEWYMKHEAKIKSLL